jgi:anthranilate phosphoribosyltransferase
VGVFSLELARIYQYIYQQSTMNYSIIHSLDGYDEISLTGDFKAITQDGEQLFSPKDFGMKAVHPEEIFGGDSVPEAAEIFKGLLEGRGTQAQNNVVIANAAAALQCYYPDKSLEQCIIESKQSLLEGKAAKVLSTLLSLS